MLIYGVSAQDALPALPDDGLACNRLEDLDAFQQTERWLTKEQFVAEAQRRIDEGMLLYTYVDNGVLLHYGWLVPRQAEATFPYVGQRFQFPPGTAVLFNAYTHPSARGRGLHEASMRRRIADAAAREGTRQICSAFESTNHVSRGVAERAGLRCQVVLYETIRFGRREAGSMSAHDYLTGHPRRA